jgi:thiol-disulfide isomerase/thioredoxin
MSGSQFLRRSLFSVALWTVVLCVDISPLKAQSIAGLWDGVVRVGDFDVPFRIEFAGEGSNIQGWFFNGDEHVTSTGGRLAGKSLTLNFDHYASRLEVTLEDGVLKGKYGNPARAQYDFEARPHQQAVASSGAVPTIGGLWEIPNDSPKGEHAWRFIVRQSGPEIAAAILRVDGDTGTLTGTFKDGKVLLSHFSGARPSVIELAPQADGTLELGFKSPHGGIRKLTAIRPADARVKGLPEPADPTLHTRVKNPNELFRFSFPDLNGNVVSNTDARFKNKVILVNVTGSWCPNCHDEAPFLAELYRKYRSLGLEIVALDFEEPEQRKDPARLQAFIKRYGIEYTYLIAGEPGELQTKIAQAENLNAWPTTFFLGRDGLVRGVHAGFAAPASGEFHTQLRLDFTNTVERLLSEDARASR